MKRLAAASLLIVASLLWDCSFAADSVSSGGSYNGKTLELDGAFDGFEAVNVNGCSLCFKVWVPMEDGRAWVCLYLPNRQAAGLDLNSFKKLLRSEVSIKGTVSEQLLLGSSAKGKEMKIVLKNFICSFTGSEGSPFLSDLADPGPPPPPKAKAPVSAIPEMPKESGAAPAAEASKEAKPETASEEKPAPAKAEAKPEAAAAPAIPSLPSDSPVFKSLATVRSGSQTGAAFAASVGGKSYLVVCTHFLYEQDVQFFMTPSNEKLEVSKPILSEDRDLALFELPEGAGGLQCLELETELQKIPHDSPVLVVSPLLDAVKKPLPGLLKGIGPRNIEVSSEFETKNIGSPILDAKTLKVIGVAAYGYRDRPTFSTKGTRFAEVRRFGLRLDNADPDSFLAFDKRRFDEDVKVYAAVSSMNELALSILTSIYTFDGKVWRPYIEPSKFDARKYPSISPVVKDWNELAARGVFVARAGKLANSPESVIARFKSQISMPIANIKSSKVGSKWMRTELEGQLELNAYYCRVFDGIRKDFESIMNR